MDGILYLSQRRGTYYFRRRVPRLSTCFRPVLVSLGTTDRKRGHKFCIQLTAYMERMLDGNLHNSLPEADVATFFQVELRRYLADLRVERVVERIDGSMTTQKARTNRLEAFVLRSLVEDGLRKEMPPARLAQLAEEEQEEAKVLQSTTYAKFMSAKFNEAIQCRAETELGVHLFSEYDKLFLRSATIDACMAAHYAIETVPLHTGDQARAAAIELLQSKSPVTQTAPATTPLQLEQPKQEIFPTDMPVKHCKLTPGVELLQGRITARTLQVQQDQAMDQSKTEGFDGIAENVLEDMINGNDLFGTVVRMIRKSRSQQDTCEQKLKSVKLFIYTTGVQLVTDIRQHHLDMFGDSMEHKLTKHYWKSAAQKDMTFKELLEVTRNQSNNSIGLASPTISRHLTTIKNIMAFAGNEGNKAVFTPEITNLVPPDKRSDAEKRSVYTFEDAQKVFNHHLWQGCKSKARRHTAGDLIIKDHHYWINLLLVYTGARRSEIAGLLQSDIDNEDGIPFLNIRENHLRGLKNRFSHRRVPLHPHIIELGFLDFVAKKRKASELVLFPEAIPAKVRQQSLQTDGSIPPYDKKLGDSLDHVWRECLYRSLDGNPDKYCLGSLRGFVNDTYINLRKDDGNTLEVPEVDRRDILGHKPRDVNEANYRRAERPLGPLYVAIKLLPRLF